MRGPQGDWAPTTRWRCYRMLTRSFSTLSVEHSDVKGNEWARELWPVEIRVLNAGNFVFPPRPPRSVRHDNGTFIEQVCPNRNPRHGDHIGGGRKHCTQ